jgi:hypothetical protein
MAIITVGAAVAMIHLATSSQCARSGLSIWIISPAWGSVGHWVDAAAIKTLAVRFSWLDLSRSIFHKFATLSVAIDYSEGAYRERVTWLTFAKNSSRPVVVQQFPLNIKTCFSAFSPLALCAQIGGRVEDLAGLREPMVRILFTSYDTHLLAQTWLPSSR